MNTTNIGEDAANGAIGEREALLADYIELNMSNYGPDDVDRLNAWAIEAYDFISRAALTAEKVAAEPIYETQMIGSAWVSVSKDEFERVNALYPQYARIVYAASQPAQVALTDEQREAVRYARSVMGSVSWETADSKQAKQVLDALLTAAQPVSGGKS